MTEFASNLERTEHARLRSDAFRIVSSAISHYNATGYAWLDHNEKADIVSDAIAKALETFNPEKNTTFHTWVNRLAWQMTCSRLSSHHDTCSITNYTEDDEEVEMPAFTNWVTAEEEVVAWETSHRIDNFVDSRSEEDRIIFTMDRDGYSAKEIAEFLGMNISNIYVRLSRIKKAVAKHLAA